MSAGSPSAGSSPRVLIAILIAVSIVNPLAVNAFVPAMPEIRRSLGADLAAVQLVLSAYLFATAGAQLFLGQLSDRFGRRPVLIGGLLVYIAASVACALATSIEMLVAARIFQGIGGCVGIVLGRAIIRDRYPREHAATVLGYVTMGFAVAPMLGPAIGGTLNDLFGWRSIFGLLAGLGTIVAIAAIVALPETRRAAGDQTGRFIASMGTLTRIPAFWAYTLALAFGTAVFFAFLGGTPFVAIDMLGMSGTEYGLYFALVPGGFIVGNFLSARYGRRHGIHFMIVAGSVVALVAVGAMGLAFAAGWQHPLALFAPMYCIGFANGLTLSNSIAGAVSVRPEIAGAASGLAGSTQLGFGAIATVAIGALLEAIPSVFTLIAAMAVIAAGGVVTAVWTRTAPGREPPAPDDG